MHKFVKKLVIFLSSGAYTGFIPVASGTWGTAVGVLLYLILPHQSVMLYLALVLLLSFGGAWVSDKAEAIWGVPDSSKIVIDEIVGYLWGMILIPATWKFVLLGFVIFRVMDILKPPPLERFEKFPKGWGVMLDDIGAGVYTCLCLHILRMVGVS